MNTVQEKSCGGDEKRLTHLRDDIGRSDQSRQNGWECKRFPASPGLGESGWRGMPILQDALGIHRGSSEIRTGSGPYGNFVEQERI